MIFFLLFLFIHYHVRQSKQRPRLPNELEALVLPKDPETARSALGLYSEADPEILKLLVSLFYQCTEGDPADRPTSQCIYKKLSAFRSQTDEAKLRS